MGHLENLVASQLMSERVQIFEYEVPQTATLDRFSRLGMNGIVSLPSGLPAAAVGAAGGKRGR